MRSAARLHQGDCLKIMPTLPAGSVDLVLCDLPYGTTRNQWDAVIPFAELWAEYDRLCRGAVVLTASQPFTSALIMSRIGSFRYTWVWDKVNRPTGHLNAKKQPLRESEDIVVFYDAQPTYHPQMVRGTPYRSTGSTGSANYGEQARTTTMCADGLRYPRNIIAIPADERGTVGRLHPTQKPVALLEYLIRTYTDVGDTVLDNTMGSGSTGVACANTGRRFVGIERDPAYFASAERRIREAEALNAQPPATDLFLAAAE